MYRFWLLTAKYNVLMLMLLTWSLYLFWLTVSSLCRKLYIKCESIFYSQNCHLPHCYYYLFRTLLLLVGGEFYFLGIAQYKWELVIEVVGLSIHTHSQLNLVGIFLDIHHIVTSCNFLLTQFAPSSFQCYISFPRVARLGCNSAGLKII